MRVDDRLMIQKHYGASAETYRDYWAPALLSFVSPIFESIPDRPADGAERRPSGLDLGCGVGVITDAILNRFGGRIRMTGADLVPEMLGQARKSLPGTDFVRVDAPRLPFPDQAFDFVLATFMLQHVREQRRTIAELYRVVKPGGGCLIATWGRNDPGCGAFEVWEDALMEFGASADDPDPPRRWDETIITGEALRPLITSAGFQILSMALTTPGWIWTPESLERLRVNMGAPARRFRAMPPAKRNAMLNEVRQRLRTLEAGDFSWSPEVRLTVAARGAEESSEERSV